MVNEDLVLWKTWTLNLSITILTPFHCFILNLVVIPILIMIFCTLWIIECILNLIHLCLEEYMALQIFQRITIGITLLIWSLVELIYRLSIMLNKSTIPSTSIPNMLRKNFKRKVVFLEVQNKWLSVSACLQHLHLEDKLILFFYKLN